MSSFVPYADAEVQGLDNVKSMKMQTSGKAFFVIIAKIYSYKIRSMIREISCNAADIHKATGQTKPFIVTVPSEFNPVFSVRDFGTGLSEDGMSLFTTVFESSKESSDTETGYYGLGSKSPFAYTTTFNVISYYNGTMAHYTIFLDGSKEPKYAKIFEAPTTEENGLEVQISVEENDISSFIKEATDVLSSMTVPYTILGAEPLEKYHFFDCLEYRGYSGDIKIDKVLDNEDVYARITTKDDRYNNLRSKWFAQLGDVLYPIDEREIGSVKLPKFFGVMRFKPKDLDIPPSRETLEYTAKTIQAIKDKTEIVNNCFAEYFNSDGAPSNIGELEYISSQRIGKDTFIQYSFKHKSIFSHTKINFTHNREDGFDYYSRVKTEDRYDTTYPIFIFDTQRTAQILKQYSLLKMKKNACHVITVNDKKTGSIVYSSKYKNHFEKLKQDLTNTGHEVYLASDLEAIVTLEKPKPKAFIYQLNHKSGSYSPILISELKENSKVLFYSSTDERSENTLRTILGSGLFKSASEFEIYKVQQSKHKHVVDKYSKKYKDSVIYTVEQFFDYLAKNEINLSKLQTKEVFYLYSRMVGAGFGYSSGYQGIHGISCVFNDDIKSELNTHIDLVKQVQNSSRYNLTVERIASVKFDENLLAQELSSRGFSVELLLKLNDIAAFTEECSILSRINNPDLNEHEKRKINFLTTVVKTHLHDIETLLNKEVQHV